MSAITHSSDIKVGRFNITASNVDRSILSALINQSVSGRRADIWLAIIEDGQVVGEPVDLNTNARLTGWNANNEENASTVQITCASHWADFLRTNGRYSTLSSQQREFPLDTSHKNASDTVDISDWGG